jgi:hypothetical protein
MMKDEKSRSLTGKDGERPERAVADAPAQPAVAPAAPAPA